MMLMLLEADALWCAGHLCTCGYASPQYCSVLLMHFGVQDTCVHVTRADQQPQWGQGV